MQLLRLLCCCVVGRRAYMWLARLLFSVRLVDAAGCAAVVFVSFSVEDETEVSMKHCTSQRSTYSL